MGRLPLQQSQDPGNIADDPSTTCTEERSTDSAKSLALASPLPISPRFLNAAASKAWSQKENLQEDDPDVSTSSQSPASSSAEIQHRDASSSARSVDSAYVTLLYGNEDYFFVYAMIVGHRCKKLCQERPAHRVIMCTARWFRKRRYRTLLEQVYTHVRLVPFIRAPHATRTQRHNNVFTKLWCFDLPYRHVIFLDLDLIPCRDLSPMFQVQAPAGLYHGKTEDGQSISDDTLINTNAYKHWCVNAGVLRLDPPPSKRERRKDMRQMCREVSEIEIRTYLPEQYFLAERLTGWRHLEPCWNMEVGTLREDPGYTWPREDARKDAIAQLRGKCWIEQDVDEVKIFHFSGQKVSPWWYIHLSPEAAKEAAGKEFQHRDPRRLIATALWQWVLAVDELRTEAATWKKFERIIFDDIFGKLSQRAERLWYKRIAHREWGVKCHRCENRFQEWEGRTLWGWEGWWLCDDCIVGYIFEPTRCMKCGAELEELSSCHWSWEEQGDEWHGLWTCVTCQSSIPGSTASS